MASRRSDTPDMYNCGICFEHLQDRKPRYLACHHYFCQSCLQKLVKGTSISCPSCREVTRVPKNGVTSLKVNSLLSQMLEKELFFVPKHAFKCRVCKLVTAKYKCKECGHLFCEGCRIKHDRLKKFKDHTIQSLCEKHADGVSHVCMKCHQEICDLCLIMDHGGHEDEVVSYETPVRQVQPREQQQTSSAMNVASTEGVRGCQLACPSATLGSGTGQVPRPIYTATNPLIELPSSGPTQAIQVPGQEPLFAAMLAAAPPQEQKQMLGERLFPLIQTMYPDLAGRITRMLLDIDNSELLLMLESRESLKAKVGEAVAVLQAHQAKETNKDDPSERKTKLQSP